VFEREALERLPPDMLVLIGEQEVVYSSTKKAIEDASSFSKIKAKLISNCPHCLLAEQKEVLDRLIKEFL